MFSGSSPGISRVRLLSVLLLLMLVGAGRINPRLGLNVIVGARACQKATIAIV